MTKITLPFFDFLCAICHQKTAEAVVVNAHTQYIVLLGWNNRNVLKKKKKNYDMEGKPEADVQILTHAHV